MNSITCDSPESFTNFIHQIDLNISSPRDIFYNKDTEVHCKLRDHSAIYPVDRSFKLYDLYFYIRNIENYVYEYLQNNRYIYNEVPDSWDYDFIVKIISDVEDMKFDDKGEQIVITRDEWNNSRKKHIDCVIFDTFMMDNSRRNKFRLAGALYAAGIMYGHKNSVSIFKKWDWVRSNDNSFVTMMPHDEFMFRFGSDWYCFYGYEKNKPKELDKLLGRNNAPYHWIHDHYQ